jgi:hypothetical protein
MPAESAQQWTPSSMISGWSVSDGTVSFPVASLVDLTAEAADGLSGDARQVALSLFMTVATWQAQLAEAPGAFNLRYSFGGLARGGAFANKQRHQYTMTAYTLPGTNLIAEE